MELGTHWTFGFALSFPHCTFMLSQIINSWLSNSLYVSQRGASDCGCVQRQCLCWSRDTSLPGSLNSSQRKKTGIYTLGASNLEVAYNLLLTRWWRKSWVPSAKRKEPLGPQSNWLGRFGFQKIPCSHWCSRHGKIENKALCANLTVNT